MKNITINKVNISKFNNGKIDECSEVLATYRLKDKVLRLETNGEVGDIYLEIVDYRVLNETLLIENGFSEMIYEIEDEQDIKNLFLTWLKES